MFRFRGVVLFVASLIAAVSAFAAPATPSKPAPIEHVLVKGQPAHPTRVLARYSPGFAPAASTGAAVLRTAGITVAQTSVLVPGLVVLDVDPAVTAPAAAAGDAAADLLDRIEALRATGLFAYVEPDYMVFADATPTDSAFVDGTLWGLRNTGQQGGLVGADIGAEQAWNVTTGSTEVIVAVIDSGVRHTHFDLASQLWRNPGEIAGNGVDDDANGYVDDLNGINAIAASGTPDDDTGHGTHVSGIIGAAANNGRAMVGVAWTVRIMPLKFLAAGGGGATSHAIACIEYAVRHGAKIVNCSWGSTGSSRAMRDAFAAAGEQGVLVIAAAGNESINNDLTPHYPSSFELENIIAVAAIDRMGNLATFSNHGATSVDVAAPGDSIFSTYHQSDTSYLTASGTSMAAPFVSGIAALVRAHDPSISMTDLRDRILHTVVTSDTLAGRVVTGGWVKANRALTHAPDGTLEVTLRPPAQTIFYSGHQVRIIARVTDLVGVTGATVTGTASDGAALAFRDDGVAPDDRAGDANYAAWMLVPAGVGSVTVDVTASAPGKTNGTASVTYTVHPPPPNDMFAARATIAGVSTTVYGTNRGASREPDEPEHAGDSGGASIWWTWTAPGDGIVTIDTIGSDFDTLLGVYTGAAPGSLVQVAANDDIDGPSQPSRVQFDAVEGATYQIAVDGFDGATGNITLRVNAQLAPPNDRFSRPATIPGAASATVSGSTANATREPGEPEHGTGSIVTGGSAWWSWTAPADGTATLTASYDPYGTPVLAAYIGSELGSLRRLPGITQDAQQNWPVRLTFPARAGETYRIAVANHTTNAGGPVTLSIVLEPGPENDRFDARIALFGASTGGSGNSTRATCETDEPVHLPPAGSGGTSLWWSWVAPLDGSAELKITAQGFWPAASVYTGGSLADLQRVATGFDGPGSPEHAIVRFRVQAGVEYQIAIDAYVGGTGAVSFTLEHRQPPPNDEFADRTRVSGAFVEVTATNFGATQQIGELVHTTGRASQATVWWEWTAPADATVYASSSGSTALVVYTGTGLHDLTGVPNIEYPSAYTKSLYTFRATAGTRYLIVVDGVDDFAGEFTLTLRIPQPPANDLFANRTRLTGASATATGDALGATAEPGEPALNGIPNTGSVWFGWTAPSTGTATLQLSGWVARHGVFTGSAVGALTPVGATGTPLVFSVTEGVEYQVLIEGMEGRRSTYELSLSLAAAPGNDHFSNRTAISGADVRVDGSNVGASREAGEPSLTGQNVGASVWWTWTAPRDGRAILSTAGSAFYPYVGVFTGTSVSSLTTVAITSRATGYEDPHRLVFPVRAGVSYHIAVQGHNLIAGRIALHLALVDPPPNDDFASRAELAGADVSVAASNLGAMPEAGDPGPMAWRGGTRSVWWRWTAPSHGRIVLDTPVMPFRARVAVYTGAGLGGLTAVADNHLPYADRPGESVVFDAVAGTTYAIGLAGEGEGMGDFTLRLRQVTPPANDLFAGRHTIPPEGGIDQGHNVGASEEAGEWPDGPRRSVWWRWTAPQSGAAGVSTAGSEFDTVLAVYRGSPATGFSSVSWNDDDDDRGGTSSRATFQAVAGETYEICVGSRHARMGGVRVELRMGQPPPAPVIEAATVSVSAMDRVTLRASVSGGTDGLHFVWRREYADIPGQHGPVLEIPCAQHFDAGNYSVTAYNLVGSTTSTQVPLAVAEVATSDSRMLNLSTRALCQSGDGVLIPGFVLAGSGTKRMLIRAIGPTLAGFGVSGTLPDPQLTLMQSGAAYATNDDWGSQAGSVVDAIIATSAEVGAFPLVAGSGDGALLVELPAGQYTVVTAGKDAAEGVAMVELYDADPGASTARLVNLSNRGFVGVGESIMIPGFVVSNEGPRRFLIRAVGYTLSEFGIMNYLLDPQLAVYRRVPGTTRDELILTNDKWNGPGSDVTHTVQEQVGAFPLHYYGLDAAFVVTLPPGIYTVHASGVGDTTGVALVEVYLVP